jgi:hypothetical protein
MHLNHLNVVFHEHFPSVIPTLQPLKLLRYYNINSMPESNVRKLGMYIMSSQSILMAYTKTSPISNTNNAATQIVLFLLSSLIIHIKVVLLVSNTENVVEEKGAIKSYQNFFFISYYSLHITSAK